MWHCCGVSILRDITRHLPAAQGGLPAVPCVHRSTAGGNQPFLFHFYVLRCLVCLFLTAPDQRHLQQRAALMLFGCKFWVGESTQHLAAPSAGCRSWPRLLGHRQGHAGTGTGGPWVGSTPGFQGEGLVGAEQGWWWLHWVPSHGAAVNHSSVLSSSLLSLWDPLAELLGQPHLSGVCFVGRLLPTRE